MATVPEERLFADNPTRLRLFRAVRELVESLGDVRVEATKSQVSFGTNHKFAWVWLPPKWERKRPHDCIVLSFGLRRQLEHQRIEQAVEPHPGRWMHHVVVAQESDLDHPLAEWLREAYELSRSV
jgi:hypothetical protein